MIHSTPLLALGLAAMLVGVAAALRGAFGSAAADRPICGRCGGDLRSFGAVPVVCPGCGATLAAPKAIRFGNRVPSRKVICLGLVAMLVGGLLLLVDRGAGSPRLPAGGKAGSGAVGGNDARAPLASVNRPDQRPAPPEPVPALVAARTIPVVSGWAVEVVLDLTMGGTPKRVDEARLRVDGAERFASVRAVRFRRTPQRPLLVVEMDLPGEPRAVGSEADGGSTPPSIAVIELLGVLIDGQRFRWLYPLVPRTHGATTEAAAPAAAAATGSPGRGEREDLP